MRILIVDDHPIFLSGLKAMLETVAAAEVIGEARGGKEAIQMAKDLYPELVLMDVDMPEVNGIEATRSIRQSCPDSAVLILTMIYDNDTLLAALRAGASGYMLKGTGAEDIARAVEAVSRGHMVFGPLVMDGVVDQLIRPPAESAPFPDLTDREREVLEMVAKGETNATIARQLGLSIKTVRNYQSRIFVKLGVAHRTEAALLARRQGLGG